MDRVPDLRMKKTGCRRMRLNHFSAPCLYECGTVGHIVFCRYQSRMIFFLTNGLHDVILTVGLQNVIIKNKLNRKEFYCRKMAGRVCMIGIAL